MHYSDDEYSIPYSKLVLFHLHPNYFNKDRKLNKFSDKFLSSIENLEAKDYSSITNSFTV